MESSISPFFFFFQQKKKIKKKKKMEENFYTPEIEKIEELK